MSSVKFRSEEPETSGTTKPVWYDELSVKYTVYNFIKRVRLNKREVYWITKEIILVYDRSMDLMKFLVNPLSCLVSQTSVSYTAVTGLCRRLGVQVCRVDRTEDQSYEHNRTILIMIRTTPSVLLLGGFYKCGIREFGHLYNEILHSPWIVYT